MSADTGFGPMDGETPAPKKPRHILLTPELLQRAFDNHRRYLKVKKILEDEANGTNYFVFNGEPLRKDQLNTYLDTLPDVPE